MTTDKSDTRPSVWYYLFGAVMYLATVAIYAPVCRRVGQQAVSSGDYSHVFVMPIIAIVIYVLTKPPAGDIPSRRLPCMLLWMFGIAFAGLGLWVKDDLLIKFTLPVTILGAVGGLFGWREALRFRLSVFLMLFAVGLPTDLLLLAFSKGLSFSAAGIAHDVVGSVLPSKGPFILRQSMVLTPKHVFDVVHSCSGTRWLVAFFILGTLVAWKMRLSFRVAVRFALALTSVAVVANILRICLTLVTTVGMAGRYSFDRIHATWNAVVMVVCVVALPFLAGRAGKWRFYPSAVRIYALLVVLGFGLTMYLKAQEGSTLRVRVNRQARVAQMQVQDSLPRSTHPVLQPDAEDAPFPFAWVVCCGFVHAGTGHFLANLAVLILIAAALRAQINGRWWPVFPLLAGQAAAAMVSWLFLPGLANSSMPVLVVGASGAVSGLFGAFLVVLIATGRRWWLAGVYGTVYVASLVLEAVTRSIACRFSVISHLVAVAVGAACALVVVRMARREGTAVSVPTSSDA